MTTLDPLALWRSAEQFSLAAVACLIHMVPPTRAYPAQRDGFTEAMREEQGLIKAALQMLQADAQELGVAVRHVPATSETGFNDFTREWHVTNTAGSRDEFGPVARAAVVAWCERKRMRPAFFFPEQTASSSDGGGKSIGTRERETLLSLIAVLCEAAGIDMRVDSRMHAEAARIVAWGAGRQLTTGAETIAKKLVEARDFIRPKGPITPLDSTPDSNSNLPRSKSNT